MKGPVTFKLESQKCNYEFSLYHNINILTGLSGSGKTQLINLINESKRRGNKYTRLTCNSDVIILSLDTYMVFNMFSRRIDGNVLYIIDEDEINVSNQSFIDNIYKSGAFFLIISRDIQRLKISFSIDSIYHLKETKVEGKIVNLFSKAYEGLVGCTFKNSPVHTEDKVSAPALLKRIGFKDINPIGGNNKISSAIEGAKIKNGTILADLAAIGRFIPELYALTEDTDIEIADCKSLEHIILHNSEFGNIHKMLDYKNSTCDFSIYKSLEKYYTDLLVKESKKVFNYDYTKSDVPEFLIDSNVRELVYKVLWRPEESNRLIDLV